MRRIGLDALTLLAAGLLLTPVVASAQEAGGRFRVLIPRFFAQGGDRGFGDRVADELRERINTLPTHQAIPEGDIEDQLDRYDLDWEDLDCLRTRQLAPQVNAQVALCASYTSEGDNRQIQDIQFWDVASSESLDVEPVTVDRNNRAEAAQHIYESFDRYVQQVRSAQICSDYAQSQQWENALENCDRSLELNPNAVSVRYQRARILYNMEDYEPALAELEQVLELNPLHEDALQLAGYIATTQGMEEEGRDYYSRYLELNPGNAAIRMRIAYEQAQAGDPVGAMAFIQQGLDVDPNNTDLLEQFGGFAFTAAVNATQEASVGAQDSGTIPPEAEGYYRQAIDAYQRVWEQKGAETDARHLSNVVSAYVQLDEIDQAIQTAERVLETHPQNDRLWSLYADALQRSGRTDEAITALERLKEINPEYPNVSLRQGQWLIQAGRVQDAVNILREEVAGDPQQADMAARLVFADAHQNGVQKENFQYCHDGVVAAKQIPNLGDMMSSQLNFWHGYCLYQLAVKQQEPQTLETARATLPKFQQAMQLFEQSEAYADTQPSITLSQFLSNTQTYIEIQEALIRRGGGY